MKYIWLQVVFALSLTLLGSALHATEDQVQFSGRVAIQSSATTGIVPTTQADGTVTYVVYSTVTNQPLASFSTLAAAQTFAAQLNPTVPYR